MVISTEQRTELGNGLSYGGEIYPDELRFGELSESERQKFIQTANSTIGELTAHKGIFFERYFGRNAEKFLEIMSRLVPWIFILMAIPLLDFVRQVLEGAANLDAFDWIRFALILAGYLLIAFSVIIASSSVHTQNYWSEFLILANDPETRDHLNFAPDRTAPKYHHQSGWLQTWGILLWILGVFFWVA
jgi:hypothetical protein